MSPVYIKSNPTLPFTQEVFAPVPSVPRQDTPARLSIAGGIGGGGELSFIALPLRAGRDQVEPETDRRELTASSVSLMS